MRQIVLDTETTGLDWRSGHRIIEIGCVELLNRVPTGRDFHKYINPERDIDAEAEAVHGISRDDLADKPKFAGIVEEFEDFVRDAELVIHNAAFDIGFLDNELVNLLRRPAMAELCAGVVDTLRLAKEQNPGKKASLDALCQLHGIDNTRRTRHGALLDAELLAEVYLAMTRGQESLMMALEEEPAPELACDPGALAARPPLRVLRASAEELAEHDRVLGDIAKANRGRCLWLPPEPAAEAS